MLPLHDRCGKRHVRSMYAIDTSFLLMMAYAALFYFMFVDGDAGKIFIYVNP